MQRTSGQTSQISKSPTKDRLARSGLDLIRSTLTLLARGFFREIDGERYSVVLPAALFSPWRVDADFRRTYDRIAPHTLVDIYRCYELWQLVGQLAPRGGHILEVGVWRGGTGCLIASRAQDINKDVQVFLCDTFEGIVKAGEHDGYKVGELADTSKEVVEALASELGLRNVKILEGIFPEETAHLIEAREFGLCHIDVDVYQSARDAAEWVWPRLQVGGVIVFDDYGFAKSGGVARYVDSLAGKNGLIRLHNLNGHGLIIKTSAGPLPGEADPAESAAR